MIALISTLSSLSTVCVLEYLRTPPTAAYAELNSWDLDIINRTLQSIDANVRKILNKM